MDSSTMEEGGGMGIWQNNGGQGKEGRYVINGVKGMRGGRGGRGSLRDAGQT